MKRGRKIGLFGGIFLLVVGGVVVVMNIPKPPVEEIETARLALAKAKEKRADVYDKVLYKEAAGMYDSVMYKWKVENKRFFLFRDYEKVTEGAIEVKIKADLAGSRAVGEEEQMKVRLEREYLSLKDRAKFFDRYFLSMPLSSSVKNLQGKGKLYLNEASVVLAKGDYEEGERKIAAARNCLDRAYHAGEEKVKSYFSSLMEWKRLLSQAIANSRSEGSRLIVVEKIPSRCFLYEKGVLKKEYPVELGKNWLGNKCYEGDDATPEGIYQITKKLSGGKTRYYKALLLNYPNADDRKRFAQAKKRGELSRSTRIGGLIEIHGDGGKGAHWTNGCVALTNKEMDTIYNFAGVGTRVLIIGASDSWDEIVRNSIKNGTE